MTETAWLLGALLVTAAALWRGDPAPGREGGGAWLPARLFSLFAVAPPVALGGLSLAAFGLLFAGLELGALSVSAAFVAVLVYLAAVERRWRAGEGPRPRAGHPAGGPFRPGDRVVDVDGREHRTSRSGAALVLLLLAGLVTVGFLGWAGARWIGAWPHGSADAVNIWTSRGLLLARAGGEIPERLAAMPQGHPDYPLLLPAALAAQYGAAGSESLLVPQLTSVAWLVALLGAVGLVTSRFTGPGIAALAAMVVATNPLLIRWAFVQCADVPLACLFLLSAGGLAALAAGDDVRLLSPGLTGFLVGLLAWTKNEGTVAAVVLVGLAGLRLGIRRPPGGATGRRGFFFVLGALPPVTALALFRTVWARAVSTPAYLGPDSLARLVDLERWRLILSTGLHESIFPGRMVSSAAVFLCLVAVVVVLLAARKLASPPTASLLLAAAAAMAGVWGVAYLLSPYELEWHVASSVDRFLLQVMPTVVVAAAMALAADPSSAPPAERPSRVDAGGAPVGKRPPSGYPLRVPSQERVPMTDEPELSVDDRSSSRHVVSFAVQMSVSLCGVDDGRPSFETAGRTINLSRDGVLARIGEHLPIERRCLVQFPESGHRIANPEVHGVIVRCDPVEDGVAVAVEFETPLEFTRSSED